MWKRLVNLVKRDHETLKDHEKIACGYVHHCKECKYYISQETNFVCRKCGEQNFPEGELIWKKGIDNVRKRAIVDNENLEFVYKNDEDLQKKNKKKPRKSFFKKNVVNSSNLFTKDELK